MSLPVSISDLINSRIVEDDRIEYQRDYYPEEVLHTICAFANDIGNEGGGYIVIGMEEENEMPRRPVTGLAKGYLDKIAREIQRN